jgi:hypothetical protein
MDKVRAQFEQHARRGITLSAEQLAAFARKKGVKVDMSELRKIRHEYKFTAFAARYRRPLRFFSQSVARYGVVFLDMGHMAGEHKKVNDGMMGFLCCVEAISGQLSAIPVRDFTTRSWEKAIVSMIEHSAVNAVRCVISDRDSAVKSNHESLGLRARLKRDFGVKWVFLKNRSKAYKVNSHEWRAALEPIRSTSRHSRARE